MQQLLLLLVQLYRSSVNANISNLDFSGVSIILCICWIQLVYKGVIIPIIWNCFESIWTNPMAPVIIVAPQCHIMACTWTTIVPDKLICPRMNDQFSLYTPKILQLNIIATSTKSYYYALWLTCIDCNQEYRWQPHHQDKHIHEEESSSVS